MWESGLSGPVSTETSWGTYNADRIEFTIPVDTPDGEYLVRPEHIAIHEGHVGKAQFYMECAQLRVAGGGNGSPGPMTQFPGAYTADEVNFDMVSMPTPRCETVLTVRKWSQPVPSTYDMPGPAVWGGGSSGGSDSGSPDTGSSSSAPASSAPAPSASASAPVFSAPVSSPPIVAPSSAPYRPTTFATMTSAAPTSSYAPVDGYAPAPSGAPAASYGVAPVPSAPVGYFPAGVSSAAPVQSMSAGFPDCEVEYVR